jgi:hypothetical protein
VNNAGTVNGERGMVDRNRVLTRLVTAWCSGNLSAEVGYLHWLGVPATA